MGWSKLLPLNGHRNQLRRPRRVQQLRRRRVDGEYGSSGDGESTESTAAQATTSTMTAEDTSRPWNLRTRRAACKAPMNGITSTVHHR
ncbi:hypothetical protein RND71_035005 [Anisodus tanguticus]|uniref:Uncharacterized protein n=1 Tax=Anisodus tanguticus TaxID=243964 RepID=A0AAE1V154_9SOLA|nr:hypothetical protein RND71_035005 [Anisodus tanguticus]